MLAQAISRSIQIHGHRPAIVGEGNPISWREFGEQVARTAGGLRSLGCKPGDRVAILAANTAEHLTMIYAIYWAGCVLVPLNTRLSVDELTTIVTQSDSVAFASDDRNKEVAQQVLKNTDSSLKSIALNQKSFGDNTLTGLQSSSGPEAWPASPSNLAALYYTGGTTGQPKGVMTSHGASIFQAQNMVNDLKLTEDSIYLHVPPIFHIAGAGTGQACAFVGGAQAFIQEIEPLDLVARIADVKATVLCLVPTLIADIVEIEEISDYFKFVQTISYGTAPISETLLTKVIENCPDLELVQFYGQSECMGPCTILSNARHALTGALSGKLNTVGVATNGNEIRIADEQGQTVENGVEGEILLRAPSVMQGYWKQPEKTAETLKDDWLHTGDAGVMDEEGFIRVVDRLKDMIITGGENVFCGEVENVIAHHPAVQYCAVIGLADEKWGERVHAVIGLKEDSSLDIEELRTHCRQHIAGYKCPKSVSFTTEPLPLSAVGKIRKDVLRKKYATG